MQIYVVAAFGLTLGERVCCEQPVYEAPCHGEEHKSESAPLQTDHSECSICLDSALHQEENCCPDCETLYVAVDNDSRLEQSFANNYALFKQQSLQAAILLLPWVDPGTAALILNNSTHSQDTKSRDTSTDIPIFIRDCTYRI